MSLMSNKNWKLNKTENPFAVCVSKRVSCYDVGGCQRFRNVLAYLS
jgi:hypothetical protein